MTTSRPSVPASTGRFPGHLRARDATQTIGLALLLRHYDRYAPFVAAAEQCHAAREACLRLSPATAARGTVRDLVHDFAARWNLDRIAALREHDFHAVEQAIAQAGMPVGGTVGRPFSPHALATALAPPSDETVCWGGQR